MPVFKFSEVLNDTVSTLLWADLQTLLDFQRERQLPADLAQVFTTEASGDEVLAQGALIALAGIANLAYTVIVRVDDADAELLQAGGDLQCQQDGYVLQGPPAEQRGCKTSALRPCRRCWPATALAANPWSLCSMAGTACACWQAGRSSRRAWSPRWSCS